MPSIDMDQVTGEWIVGWPRTKQSIHIIITTPRFSRVLRRLFGSGVFDLIDAPMTDSTILKFYNVIAMALAGVVEEPSGDVIEVPEFGEPCFELRRVQLLKGNFEGEVHLLLSGVEYPNGYKGDYSEASAIERHIDFVANDNLDNIRLAA
jgi:hypothetical protein